MRIRERLLAQIWERQWIKKDALLTVGGEEVQVIYPGRENSDSGPDYCDALITIGGGIPLKGDVELHIRSREWRSHGHYRDPNYDGVILHVVMWNDRDETCLLHSGKRVPILALYSYLVGTLEELQKAVHIPLPSYEPCYGALERYGIGSVAEQLDKAGEQRFYFKVEKFRKSLETEEVRQVVYEGVMRALGYAKNKEPFEELAQMLPISFLWKYTEKGDIHTLQALMLGTAGLLPLQRHKRGMRGHFLSWFEPEVRRLELIWESFGIEEGGKMNWRFFRVRPENFPPRRIAAASYLLSRYGDKKKLGDLLNSIGQTPFKKLQKELERCLVVRVDDCWANHFDFGLESKWNPSLIGLGRAREIVVNVLLPFFFAWADDNNHPRLKERVMELYGVYPRLGENWVTRYMEKQIFGEHPTRLINSAGREQGLIHLYQNFCVDHRCIDCPLT